MRRKTFDFIAAVGGAMIVVLLVAAGSLGLWAYNYANSNVHNQLAAQKITFPTRAQDLTPGSENYPSRSFLLPYAGQEVLTGAQANAYAMKIRNDVAGLPDHGVYSLLSAASMKASAASKADPTNAALAAQATTLSNDVATSFKAVTLEGLLLEAYSFSTFGQIALVGAIVAFCLAFVMLILSGLGFWHYRRTPEDMEVLKSLHHEVREPVGV